MGIYNVGVIRCDQICSELPEIIVLRIITDQVISEGNTVVYNGYCYRIYLGDTPIIDPITVNNPTIYSDCDECVSTNNVFYYLSSCGDRLFDYCWRPRYSLCNNEYFNFNGVCFGVKTAPIDALPCRNEIDFPTEPTVFNSCQECIGNGYQYVLPVYDCLTQTILYYLGSNVSYLVGTVVSFTLFDDPETQLCGVVGELEILNPIVTGGIISDLPDCETCLSQTNKKVELINCIDGSVEVTWASFLYSVGDITNVDFIIPGEGESPSTEIKCCYTIGEETEALLTIPTILGFNPSVTCQKCIECNGAYYSWEDCNDSNITGYSLSYQYMEINDTFISPENDNSCKKVTGTFQGNTLPNLPGSLSENTLNGSVAFDDIARCFGEQSDGKIIVGGKFITFDGSGSGRIVRLNSDINNSTYDSTFAAGFGNIVLDIEVLSDDKILVGGQFITYNGFFETRNGNYIYKLNSDGTPDTSFLPVVNQTGFDDGVQVIKVQSDGKILVGGWFDNYDPGTGNVLANRIIRLNSDGSVDTSFVTGTGFINNTETDNGRVMDIDIQTDGKIIVVGQFDEYNGNLAKGIVRLNSDGSIDSTFNSGSGFDGNPFAGYGYFMARSINLYADGRMLIGGHFEYYKGNPVSKLIRLNSDGSVDTTFNSLGFANNISDSWIGGGNRVIETKILPDGKIMVVGFFQYYDSVNSGRVVRLFSNGQIDTSFYVGDGFNDYVLGLFLKSNGRLLVAGQFTSYRTSITSRIAELNLESTFETINSTVVFSGGCEECATQSLSLFAGDVIPSALNGGIDDIALSLREQPDGKLLIGGWYGDYNGDTVNSIFRVNTDGSLDPTFQNNGLLNDAAYGIDLQSDGKILVGGWFDDYNSQPVVNGFARLNSDGTLDTSFLGNTGFTIDSQQFANNTIKVLPDDKILVGGGFVNYNHVDYRGVMKFNQDGSVDNTFNVSGTGIYNDFNPSNTFNEQIGYYQGFIACYSKNLDKRFIYFYNQTVGVSISGNPFYFSETFSLPIGLQSLQYSVGTNLLVGWDNTSTVLVIDPITYNIISTQSYGSSVINLQRGVTTNSDYLYIYNNASPQTIEVFNILTNTLVTSLPIPGLYVSDIVFNSVNNKIYFVCGDDNIYSIDTLTNTLSTTINVGVGGSFQFLTVDTNNNKLYAQNLGATPRQLFVFDCSTDTPITAITLPNINVGKPVFNENQNLVYVPNGSLIVIDTTTDTIIDTQTPLNYDSNQLLFDDNNGLLILGQSVYDPIVEKDYVSDYLFKGNRGVKNTVNNLYYICKESAVYTGSYPIYPLYIFDPSNNNLVSTIDLPERGNFITYESTLNTIWVTTDNYLLEIDCNTNTIVNSIGGTYYDLVFDNNFIYTVDYINNYLTKFSYPGYVTTNLSVGVAPIFLTKDNDNNRIYVSNSGSNDVSVVDLSTFTVTNTIPVGNTPRNIIYNYNDQTIYVNNNSDGTFSYIDASTLIVGGTFTGTVGIDMKIDSNGYLITSQGGIYEIYNLITKTQVGNGNFGGSTGGILMDGNNTILVFENNIYDQYPFLHGRAYTFNVQSDGSILIGGYFKYYNNTTTRNLVKVLANGQIDPTFNIGNGFSGGSPLPGSVRNVLSQPDGKFICTGHFTSYDGNSVNRIVRLNSDGSIDNTFNIGSGFDNRVLSSILQSDGKIICIGEFTDYDGTPANSIIRLNSDGSIDTTFVYGSGFDDLARTMYQMSNGDVVVSGYFDEYDGNTNYNNLVRLLTEPTTPSITLYEFTPCFSNETSYIYLDNSYTPSGSDIIRANIGENNLVCGTVGGIVEEFPIDASVYTTTNYTILEDCESCVGDIFYGVTLRNCETGEITYRNMTPQNVFDVLINGSIFNINTECFQIIDYCIIPYDVLVTPQYVFDNCDICLAPRSANTETFICIPDCDFTGSTAAVPPHPVWTDGYGKAVVQLNMVVLGGPNGLNG